MYQSKLFTKILREAPKDEISVNAILLIRAGFVEKLTAGIYSFLPLGLRVLKRIESVIREEIDSVGGQEILMPALHPKENWLKTGRWQSFEALFKLKGVEDKEYALGATHEEIVVPLAQKFLFSYKDLPFAIYQIQTKFRNEMRATSGLLRAREFIMKDLYSFHTDHSSLDVYYDKVRDAYFKIFRRCGLGDRTFLTLASGGTFSKYSHEFQTVSKAGEDVIFICKKCDLAVNREIKNETPQCPSCASRTFKEERAIEVGNIFKLGARYSEPFGLTYRTATGEEKPVIMGCYGIGPSRVIGAVVETSNDEKGIIWPEEIAPFDVHLLTILGQDDKMNSQIKKTAEGLYRKLGVKVEVLYDDREKSAGEKFAEADLIGIPHRIVISERTLKVNSAEIKERKSSKTQLIKISHLSQFLYSKIKLKNPK